MGLLDRIIRRGPTTPSANPSESDQTQVRNSLYIQEDAPSKEAGKDTVQRKVPPIGIPVDLQKVGYPIDVIYSFIHRDYFRIGYSDALVYGSKEYSDIRQSIIRNELKNLFQQINLIYSERIGNIDERIEEAESNMLYGVAKRLRRTLETFNEHVKTLKQMEDWLDSDDPRMTGMLASYRMGYAKGFLVSCGDELKMTREETNDVVPLGQETAITENSKTA